MMRSKLGVMLQIRGTIAVLAAMTLFSSGCAVNRGILDVRLNAPENPSSGKVVSIVRVTDCRQFHEAPPEPFMPSLKNKNEITDKSITTRAVARKRNGYGKAMGDILLPEGRTVEDLVKEALTKSLRQAGYRVVDNAASPQGDVIQIEADIHQFWSWVDIGFWTLAMNFKTEVKVVGDIPPHKERMLHGQVQLHVQAADTSAWRNTINKGLASFVDDATQQFSAN